MKRFTRSARARAALITVLFSALLTAGLLVPSATAAQQPGKSAPGRSPTGKSAATTSDTSEIKRLQQERIDVLRQAVEVLSQMYLAGVRDFRPLVSAQIDLMNARLDASDQPEERVALLKEQLTLAEKTMQYAEERYKLGAGSQVDCLQSRALCLDIRIRLLREQARSKTARK
jgi:outer membrane protein TolC